MYFGGEEKALNFFRSGPVQDDLNGGIIDNNNKVMPMIETSKIPIPAQRAYTKLKSKCFSAKIKILKEMP